MVCEPVDVVTVELVVVVDTAVLAGEDADPLPDDDPHAARAAAASTSMSMSPNRRRVPNMDRR